MRLFYLISSRWVNLRGEAGIVYWRKTFLCRGKRVLTFRHHERELRQIIQERGLLKPQSKYHIRKAIESIFFLLCFTGLALVYGSYSGFGFFLGLLFAFTCGQLGFMAHDAAHGQIVSGRRGRIALGIIFWNLLLGGSVGWWMDKHGRHHRYPNEIGKDPDITFPVVIFSPEQVAGKNALQRFFIKHQAAFFLPLVALMPFNMKARSIIHLVKNRSRGSLVEAAALALHYIGYAFLIYASFDFWQAITFVAVHHGLLGIYFSAVFAPNHKGMPMLGPDNEIDNFTRQIMTARNFRVGGWLLEFLCGGQSYQIEHHLFPSMPRCNLRRAAEITKSFCRDRGIPYKETSMVASFVEVFRSLKEVSRYAQS